MPKFTYKGYPLQTIDWLFKTFINSFIRESGYIEKLRLFALRGLQLFHPNIWVGNKNSEKENN